MSELETLLSVDLYADVESVIASNTEPLKSIYLKYSASYLGFWNCERMTSPRALCCTS